MTPLIAYPDTVQYLYSLGNEVKSIKLGLDRVAALLEALGSPERAFRSVHVAGTNGKGSVCVMIESGLRASGLRTGLFTSPHLVEPTERIQVNGSPVSREQFAASFQRVHSAVNALLDREVLDAHATYFETITAMAFDLFRENGVDIAVVETGLGGRLDATTALSPELCVVTQIDFDHEGFLGNSIESIAREKAGIFKPGVPAVSSRQRPAAMATLRSACASLHETSAWEIQDLILHARGCRYNAAGEKRYSVECQLAGAHQVENSLTAVAALHQMGVAAGHIECGIREARWPGRLERVADSPDVILDGAHNPAGVRALADYLTRFYADRRVWLIFGTMRDKSVGEIGEVLSPLAHEIILTAPDSARAVNPGALVEWFDHERLRTAPNLTEALRMAEEAQPNDVICIAGSLQMVGEARARFLG